MKNDFEHLEFTDIADKVLFGLLLTLAALLPFNVKIALSVLPALGVLLFAWRKFKGYQTSFRGTAYVLLLFVLYIIWSIPLFLKTHSLSFFEKHLVFLSMPVFISFVRVDNPKMKVLFTVCIIATVISYLLSLSAGVYHFFYTVPKWGRASDFLFHEQLSNAILDIHPTYYSMLGCLATLLALYVFSGWKQKSLVLILTIFIFLLDAKITVLIQIMLLLVFYAKEYVDKYKKVGLLIVCAIAALLIASLSVINSIYDYPHRNILVNISSAWDRSQQKDISDADGGIVTRLAIWQSAFSAVAHGGFSGAGVGNETEVLLQEYSKRDTPFLVSNEFNSHNQLLSFLISFGPFGTLLILGYFGYGAFIAFQKGKTLYVYFLIIVMTCCLTESMFNTLFGLTIISFFNSLLFLKYVQNEQ